VALLVPEPVATEIDGLRRALGDPGLTKVVPHITLVNPVNVAVDRLPEVLADLRVAAAGAPPIELRLGSPATFSPVSPVVYLPVEGTHVDVVHEVREVLRSGVLARRAVHEFVPHVTVSEEASPERIEAALASLEDYTADVCIDRVHLLQDHAPGPRRWNPVADAMFEAPLVVGTGGVPMEIASSALADPEVVMLFVDEQVHVPPGAAPIVVVARREREIVAAARGWIAAGEPSFVEVVGDQDVGRQLLRAATRSIAGRA